MPVLFALFAYLIALCLLLGGGYGAMNWLAAPEPVKVAAKATPKQRRPPPYEARAEQIPEASQPASSLSTTVAEPASARDDDHAHEVASSSNDAPAPDQAKPDVATPVQGAPMQTAATTPDRQTRSVHAEVSPDEARRKAEQPIRQPTNPVASGNPRTKASAPDTIARAPTRPSSRQASNRSEKRPLAVMTLRTIEFPDGRRETRLIPYEGRERALAFESDD
jgi:hypothetical protein